MSAIITGIIFVGLCIRKIIYRSDDFAVNNDLFLLLVEEVENILGKDNVISYTRTGSTACGISIGSSDIDIGIYVESPLVAISELERNGYVVTKRLNHFVNLTKLKNPTTRNLDTDVKIYFHKEEVERLRHVCTVNARNVNFRERLWVVAQKIYFSLINNMVEYEKVKLDYYRRHGILKPLL